MIYLMALRAEGRWENRTPVCPTQLCFETEKLLTWGFFASVLPLMEEPSSKTFLNLDTRQMLYILAWRIMQLQSRLWGFLSCKGHMAAIGTFPAHKANGLDPAVKTICASQNTPPH